MINNNFKNRYLGVLYLLKEVSENANNDSRIIIREFLGISDKDEKRIIRDLVKSNILREVGNGNIYCLDKSDEAKKEFITLLNYQFELENFYRRLQDNYKKVLLKQILDIEHKNVEIFFEKLVSDLLNFVKKAKINDVIYVNLELLEEYIYRVPNDALKIIKSIISDKNPLKPTSRIAKGWGVNGKSHNDLVLKCIELLDRIRYLELNNVFDLLIKLSLHEDQSVQSKARETLRNIADYNLYVLRKIDYEPQMFLLNEFEEWNDEKLINYFDVLSEISEELLSPSFEGHSMRDYKTFVLQFGSLKISENLRKIRERTFILLKKLYSLAKNVKQEQKVIQTLQGLTRLPDRGDYDKHMENMVLDNANALIDYYISIIPNADNEIIKDIEEDAHWLPRRFDANKLARIEELKSLISSNKEYAIFRVFVGHEHYDTAEKEEKGAEKIGWKEARARRQNKMQGFINDISEENYKDWERKILSMIKNYSSPESQGEFGYFNFFLNELGKQKPEIAYKLLIENEVKLEPFLPHLIAGIWESKLKKIVRSLISKWIKEGKYLSACALVFDYVGVLDKSLINEIFNKAKEIENKDVQNDTFNNIIRSIVKDYPKHKNTRKLFINCIKELTKNKNWDWIFNEWNSKNLKSLTRADVNVILKNLLTLPDIRYPAKEFLAPIAEKYPKKVINFFYERFLIQKEKKIEEHYDAIPYDLYELNQPLSKNAGIIIPEILKWFKKKDALVHREGGHLVKAIFPTFNEILEKELIKLIGSKNKKNIRIVFSILHAYRGEEFLHNICKELIKEYPENDDYHESIFFILSQMGVVSGEYGFVKGFEKKKEEIQIWKKDKNKAIQLFVKKYEDYLDKQILHEKKQADENIELRKRRFDS